MSTAIEEATANGTGQRVLSHEEELVQRLAEPFPIWTLEFKGKETGFEAIYADARAFVARLNEVFPLAWSFDLKGHRTDSLGAIHFEGVLTLHLPSGDRSFTSTGSEPPDLPKGGPKADKGADTDAFKRACFRAGVAAYIYGLQPKRAYTKVEIRNAARIHGYNGPILDRHFGQVGAVPSTGPSASNQEPTPTAKEEAPRPAKPPAAKAAVPGVPVASPNSELASTEALGVTDEEKATAKRRFVAECNRHGAGNNLDAIRLLERLRFRYPVTPAEYHGAARILSETPVETDLPAAKTDAELRAVLGGASPHRGDLLARIAVLEARADPIEAQREQSMQAQRRLLSPPIMLDLVDCSDDDLARWLNQLVLYVGDQAPLLGDEAPVASTAAVAAIKGGRR